MDTVCADCGARIEYNEAIGQWGETDDLDGWFFACRVESGLDGRALRIDYHCIDLASQRHFVPVRT